MSPTLDAFLRSWPSDPALAAVLVISFGIYLRGWLALRQRDPARWHGGRLAAMGAGLAAIYLALASPIEPFASLLLQMHMVQHLLLMVVAPPLVWLAAPLIPMLRGLPHEVRTVWVFPLLRWRPLRQLFGWLTRPLIAWLSLVATTWLWHLPQCYELALRSPGWHVVEHLCFAVAGLLFWYPIVRPYPSRPRWNEWVLLPYLVLAGVQNTVLAAWLTFSGRVIYPHYAAVPRVGGIDALVDQAAAGATLWVAGSIALLLPLFAIVVTLLSPSQSKRRRRFAVSTAIAHRGGATSTGVTSAAPKGALVVLNGVPSAATVTVTRPAPDVLGVPLFGRLLRSAKVRVGMQWTMALLAAILVYDGLRGPDAAPMNLAGVVPWIHWRGVLVLGLLVAGNFFCMACPFTLSRAVARRLPGAGLRWPSALRTKWPAVALLGLFLWSYEAFALWDSPWLTAWIVVGYFAAALVVDCLFREATFCKYVCPIGQFNFVQSLVSPWEVKVREPAICASCRTRECIRGSTAAPGCQMQLDPPRKSGNLDCTFCLDCVRACPHENIGVLAVGHAHQLWSDRLRSGVGRFSQRADLAALVVVLTFGALANAGGMVAPVVAWIDRLRDAVGGMSMLAATGLYYVAALVVVPLVAVCGAARLSRALGRSEESWPTIATRYAFALVPIGFAMWLAHYTFHFWTSVDTIVPTTQRLVADLGYQGLGAPMWQLACCRPASDSLLHAEILMLDGGMLMSLYVAFRIAEDRTVSSRNALRAVSPWAGLIVALFLTGVWIVFQPMEMRGTMDPAAPALEAQAIR